MRDLASINSDQLATVTDRLLLHRGAMKRRANTLRVPRRLVLVAAMPAPATPSPRCGRLEAAALAICCAVAIALSGAAVGQRVAGARLGAPARHELIAVQQGAAR